jgi:glutaminyl-peptide cyclotransferase
MIYRAAWPTWICLFLLFSACANHPDELEQKEPESVDVPLIAYTVKDTFLHDTTLFTEGLLVHEGQLFESTGSPAELPQTKSLIGISDLKNGRFIPKIQMDGSKYFGEGIVILNGLIYQLTYKNRTGFIYDLGTFQQLGSFRYASPQGWSLTTDGTDLIMSDSTDKLIFLDPVSLKPVRTLAVTVNGNPLFEVNELEYIKGFIYGNVWKTNYIVKIDPATGKVLGKLDLGPLDFNVRLLHPDADVPNGIAYDSVADKIFITGKLWPYVYQIDFAH